MNFLRAGLFLGASTAIRLATALIAVKLIVVHTGVEGLGQIGFLMNAIGVLATVAGGGILNGITKRVAERQGHATELRLILGTSSTICIAWSLVIGVLLVVFAEMLSNQLFQKNMHAEIFRWLAAGQFFMTCATLLNGYMSGHRMTSEYAFLSAVGSLIGMAGVAIGVWQWGLLGGMLGLVWLNASPGLVMLCWSCMSWPRATFALFQPAWASREATTLFKFSLMLSISALTLPLTQLYLQKLINGHAGWDAVGYWQAAVRYTDTATQFLTVVLSNYYLPKLAHEKKNTKIILVVLEAYKFAVPAILAFASLSIFFTQSIILLLYSKDLLPAQELFFWQVVGTCFKLLAYIIGYVAVARASVWVYVSAEIFQATTLCLMSRILIPSLGATGANIAYATTYILYFLVCVIAMKIFILKSKEA
jgi:antigen flippase